MINNPMTIIDCHRIICDTGRVENSANSFREMLGDIRRIGLARRVTLESVRGHSWGGGRCPDRPFEEEKCQE